MRALGKIVFMTERNCIDMSISFFLGAGNMTLQSAYLFLAVSHFLPCSANSLDLILKTSHIVFSVFMQYILKRLEAILTISQVKVKCFLH